MKFALLETYRYWWPVSASIPDPANPGKFISQTFKAEFEAEPREEAVDRMSAIAAMPADEQVKHELDELRRIVKNWDEVTGADNVTPVPFSEAVFEKALRFTWFRIGLYRAYAESLNGDQARLKN